MNNDKLACVKSLNAHERFEYFIRKVADFETLWGGYGKNGWIQLLGDNEQKVMPFWPEKQFTIDYILAHNYDYLPKEIDLSYFLDKWINGLSEDHINILIFPVKKQSSTIIKPFELKSELEKEIEQYN